MPSNRNGKRSALATTITKAFALAFFLLLGLSANSHAGSNTRPAGSQGVIQDDGNWCAPFLVNVNTTTPVAVSTRTANELMISTIPARFFQFSTAAARRYLTVQVASFSTAASFDVCLGTSTSMLCSATSTDILLSTNQPVALMSYEERSQAPMYALGASGQGSQGGSARLRGRECYNTGD